MSVFTGLTRFLAGAVLVLGVGSTLTSCGGGGGAAGTPLLGGGSSAVVTDDLALTILGGKSTVPNTGAEQVTITVTALDRARNVIGNAPVSVSVNNNAFVTPSGTTTDKTSGQITAAVSIGSDHTNRTITVTATSGAVSRSITFDVVTGVNTAPLAADLTLLLSTTNISDSGSDVVNVTVTAVDASRNALPGIPVSFKIDQNAVLVPAGNATDTQGQVTAKANIGGDRSNRLVTITASSGLLVKTASFLVTGAKLQGTAVPALPVAGSTGNKVDYRLTDVNLNPMAGVPITITAPGLTPVTDVTDSNGAYVYLYTAPTTPGPIDITALAGGATTVQTVTVPSGTSTVPAASPTVVSASVSASPNVVKVNTTGTANRAEIRAMFLAANNAPVKNVRVRFDLNGDVNNVGGTFSSGTNLVYSDALGVATTNYSPEAKSSPTDGVTIRACWDYNDFVASACPNQATATLTVVGQPYSISIGTNEAIQISADNLTYIKNFVLLVVDSAGNAVPDVQITPSVDLVAYFKGHYSWNGTSWIRTQNARCLNEDINRNGLIDLFPGGTPPTEDINGSLALEPRKSDVAISMVGSTKTDASGTAVLQLQYAKSVASWDSFKITASAAGVLSPPAYYPVVGPEALLPVDADAIKKESPPPAFVTSPYGDSGSCTDVH